MQFHELLRHWESFSLLIGTAGATLAGLTFVAVTAANRLVRERNTVTMLRVHIDPSVLAFTLALVLGCVLLFPTLTPLALGLTALCSGVFYGGYTLFVVRQLMALGLPRQYDRLDWLFFILLPMLGSVLIVLGGAQCLRGETEMAVTLMAVGLLALLVMGIRNALDVLIVTLNYEARSASESVIQGAPDDAGRGKTVGEDS
jgi:hypothetical protein